MKNQKLIPVIVVVLNIFLLVPAIDALFAGTGKAVIGYLMVAVPVNLVFFFLYKSKFK